MPAGKQTPAAKLRQGHTHRNRATRANPEPNPPEQVSPSIQSAKPPHEVLMRGARRRTGAEHPGGGLVVITGMSGSGKGSVLRAFEDLGFYCVDNLPVDLIGTFGELCQTSREISHAALVVDVREGEALNRFPVQLRKLRSIAAVKVLFLEASDEAVMRRYSETRRPHPLAGEQPISQAIHTERERLKKIRAMSDMIVDTTKFNVHELRALIHDRFKGAEQARSLLISCTSFGYRYGVPPDSDLVFDVRFLPNPNYIPQFRPLSGKHSRVAKYIKSFPQTQEFIGRISELLIYLIPHYIREGKSYLTIAFGCTGGQHRSVTIADAIRKRLAAAGFKTKVVHRDVTK
jgi:UPF0042 nucleotide-binding protein